MALLVVMATAFFGSMRKAPQYVANCEVLFGAVAQDPTDANSKPIETLGGLEDQVHYMMGPEIRSAAAAALHVDPGVLGAINATVIQNTQTFSITVVQGKSSAVPNPAALSGKTCNAIATAYINFKIDAAREFYKGLLKRNLQAQAETYQKLQAIQAELNAAEAAHDQNAVTNFTVGQDTYLQSYSTLQQKGNALQTALSSGLDGGPQLTARSTGGAPVGAGHAKNLMLAAIVGLIFGIGIAFIREYLDDTVRDKEMTQKELGLPVLANVPAVEDAVDGFGEPNGATVEAARQLRAALAGYGFPQDRSVLMVTSTMGKSRSTTLASLAAAVAESGRSVLVIGTDLRGGRTHESFGVANTSGLVNVVRGQVSIERAIRPAPAMEGVYVLPSGPVASNPGEILSSEEMAFTLRRARRWADVVLLDAPPVLSAADSSILGAYADGVVLVLAAGRTNRAQATEAKDQLQAAGAQVLGVVLIGSDDVPAKQNDSFDIPSIGGFGGGWDAYDASAYDDAYGEGVVTASARMEPYARARRSGPAKKTAASRAGQKPRAQRQPAVPRNARTRSGQRSTVSRAPARKTSSSARTKSASTTRSGGARTKSTSAARVVRDRTPARKLPARKLPARGQVRARVR